MQLFHPNQMSKFVFEEEKFFNDVSSHQIYECVCIPGVTHPQGRLDQCLGGQLQHHCSSSSNPGGEEVPLLKKKFEALLRRSFSLSMEGLGGGGGEEEGKIWRIQKCF